MVSVDCCCGSFHRWVVASVWGEGFNEQMCSVKCQGQFYLFLKTDRMVEFAPIIYVFGRFSVSNDLKYDAERDLRDIGAKNILVHSLNKV